MQQQINIFEALAAPFPRDAVSWRVGSMTKDKAKAKALAYLDARDVMDRLDAVCKPDGWHCEYLPMHNSTTCCRIGIVTGTGIVWKSNGAGATDIEAEKGAYSDAFKRAAVLWGVGRYLYGIASPWIALNEWKQIPESALPGLRALLPEPVATKSAYRARKDGDWKKLAAELKACTTDDAIDVFLDTYAQDIAEMPPKWKTPHWDDLVAATRTLVREAA
jgi:hypothetical protein